MRSFGRQVGGKRYRIHNRGEFAFIQYMVLLYVVLTISPMVDADVTPPGGAPRDRIQSPMAFDFRSQDTQGYGPGSTAAALTIGDPQPFFAFTHDSLNARAFSPRNLPSVTFDAPTVAPARPAMTSKPVQPSVRAPGIRYSWSNVPVTLGNPLTVTDYTGSFAHTFGLSNDKPGEPPSDWPELSGWGWRAQNHKPPAISSELLLTLPAAVNPVPFPGSALLAAVGLTSLTIRGVVRRLRGA